tara:strand:- start:48504 stop:48614 length:111 start_codon:yes stop_codon:yes gene_type:complete
MSIPLPAPNAVIRLLVAEGVALVDVMMALTAAEAGI